MLEFKGGMRRGIKITIFWYLLPIYCSLQMSSILHVGVASIRGRIPLYNNIRRYIDGIITLITVGYRLLQR